MYPARVFTIPDYGWKVELYEASLAELDELVKSQAASEEAFSINIMSFIKNWNCVDKAGQPLPVEVASLRKIPQSALINIIGAIRQPFKDDDPKNGIEQLPSSGPAIVDSP